MHLLVIGAGGQLGRELMCRSPALGFSVTGVDIEQLDITEASAVMSTISELRPGIVVSAAAYTAVDHAEADKDAAFGINQSGTGHVAHACNDYGIPLIHISTDYVFDGEKGAPYHEDDRPHPLNVYGKSKLAGEREVKRLCAEHLIVRTSWLFSSHGQNFVKTMLRLGRGHETVRVVNDQFGCPTPAADLADTILRMSQAVLHNRVSAWGIYHYCGMGAVSWYDFAGAIFSSAEKYGPFALKSLQPINTSQFPAAAVRPRCTVLSCERIKTVFGIEQRPWTDGLHRVIQELYVLDS